MVEQWDWYTHIASLLLPLLMLLIVIYDGFDTYNETYNETTIVDWYVDNDDDDAVQCQFIC